MNSYIEKPNPEVDMNSNDMQEEFNTTCSTKVCEAATTDSSIEGTIIEPVVETKEGDELCKYPLCISETPVETLYSTIATPIEPAVEVAPVITAGDYIITLRAGKGIWGKVFKKTPTKVIISAPTRKTLMHETPETFELVPVWVDSSLLLEAENLFTSKKELSSTEE